ncbi:MAG: family 16 glycosylhydrolase [Lachnospiraceae bacterium]|nr:family 16 glycosylhydrolase [Lachnospiraceae bacterium]
MKRKVVTKQILSAMLSLGMVLTSMNIPSASLTVKGATENLLGNSDFSSALTANDEKGNWCFWSDRGSSSAITDNALAITVAGEDANEHWHTQLTQRVALEDNTVYQLSFDAVSTQNASVGVELQETNNWGSALNGGMQTFQLTADTPQEITVFTTDAYAGFGNAKLSLQFSYPGNPGAVITVSDLSLTAAGETPVIAPDPVGREYDFSATAENAAKDFADPGKTKDGYTLVWNDEFDGNYGNANVDPATGLNLDNWAAQLGDGTTDCGNPGWGNKELQAYTANAKNIGVNEDLSKNGSGDGLLRITAAYEPNGYVYEKESPKKYTSARLRTTKPGQALFNTTYGYVEARISLPETKGAWPAFWMLPESTTIYGNWPISGEIDIMETVGAGVNGNQACGTLHWGAPEHVYKGSGYVGLSSSFSHFHTYAVDWEPGKMTWYYDGQPINTLTNWKGQIPGTSDALSFDAPFDEPFYMLLNLAVDSGQFGGTANKAAFEDQINMYVDYVRVYHKTDGYAPEAVRVASDETKDDWADYAGINQIPALTSDSIDLASKDGMADATCDTTKWALSNQDDGKGATISAYTNNNAQTFAKVGIAQAGANDYSVQLIGHYDAKAGYVYKVSFDAYADGGMVGKTVNCDSKEWNSWGAYGIQSFTLTDEPSTTEFLFAQPEDFDKCRIEFNVGAQATGNVYIGNVKVEIVDPAALEQEAQIRKPLSDGNLIYNGSFDQGEHHTGYWRAAEGTTLAVPRFTTEALQDTDLSVLDVAAGQVHYYERRAQVSAEDGKEPTICQPDLKLKADTYTVNFDLYSKENTYVTVDLCRVNDDGTLGDQIISSMGAYKASSGVHTYSWTFTTKVDAENAALVLRFPEGASVQIDNVSMIGKSQAAPVDETPVTPDDVWQGNTAGSGGAAINLAKEGNTWVASGVNSDPNAWYTPQIGSNDFDIVGGKSYTLTFKVKMDANTNQTFEYIIQEDGGGWAVAQDVVAVDLKDLGQPDEDGFYTYTKEVNVASSIKNTHVNFGLGHSQAANGTFRFKDVEFTLKPAEANDDVNGAGTLYEAFYTIDYDLDGGTNADSNPIGYGSVSGNTAPSLSLAPAAKDGFTFLGWTLEKNSSDYITSLSTDRTGDITLYAHWEKEKAPDAGPADDMTKPGKETQTPDKHTDGSDKEAKPAGSEAKPGNEAKPGSDVKTPGEPAKAAVEKITLTGISKKIAAGKKITLTAALAPANAADQTLTWKSSNPKYATVSDKGVVTTKKAGAGKTVTITAAANDGSGKIGTYKIRIMKHAVKKITLKASKKTVKAGKSVKIRAKVNPSDAKTNRTLTWSVDNSAYATVSKKGVVKTTLAGKGKTVKITAAATDGSNKKKTITIKIS